jgi:benzoyl-CoA reductase/2-hydroxyglutaryl-CoA dehydratase subunit BcrC/BadD/HgdB
MRPEMFEYHYDWLMASVLNAASKVTRGTCKETALAYRYIPYFKGVVKSFIDAGDVGVQIFKLFAQYYDNVLTAHERGKKIAAITFCFSPSICYAMDVVPVCTELFTALGGIVWKRGMFDYLDYACEVGLPDTSCSSQRGAMGAYFSGMTESIDFYVCDTPGICDTNANAFAFAAAYMNKPFYQLNYPQNIGDQRTEDYHLEDYKELIRFMEAQTGNQMDHERLAEVLAEVEKQDALIADLEDMQALVPTPFSPIYSIALYAGRFTFAGHKEYTVLLETMVREAIKRAEAGTSGLITGQERLRAYFFYIDHFTLDMNFWNWLNENGIAHIGSMLSNHFRDNIDYARQLDGVAYGIDMHSPESMLNSIAQMNSRLPMVRSIRGPYDRPNMWLEETLLLARHFKADCLIYNGTPGCRNTWANVKLMARDLEKHGYPVHIMNDDAFDDRVESWDSTRERLEEFIKVRGLL